MPSRFPGRIRSLAVASVLAVVPDLDFFLVWVVGLDHSWHRGFSHSIAFAIGVGALLFLLSKRPPRENLAWTLAVLSHGLLDWATTRNGYGVALLWPFSNQRFELGLIGLPEFSATLASRHVIHPMPVVGYELALELVLFLPVLLFAWFATRNRRAT